MHYRVASNLDPGRRELLAALLDLIDKPLLAELERRLQRRLAHKEKTPACRIG